MRGAQIAGALLLCIAIWPTEAETPAAASSPVPAETTTVALATSRTETGKASWYGEAFHGRMTASGARFNMFALTAAHRTLPLGSLVRVTNLHNQRSAIIRINDRGPIPQRVVLDVSYATARALNFVQRGTTLVRIDLLEPTGSTNHT